MKKSNSTKMLAVLICSMLIWTSCSTGWITEAEQIVATLIPGTANLLTLIAAVQGKNISAADLQTVQNAGTQAEADLQVLESLITQYEKADGAAQPGLLNQIQAALSSVQSNLNGLLPASHIEDAAAEAKVSAVIGILISEVDSMAAIIPRVSAGPSAAFRSSNRPRVSEHALLTADQFVSGYNATMAAKTGNAELDRATSGLKIHWHGKLARWASAGLLK